MSAVPNRGQSHILGLQYVIGYDFIAPRRSNSAHLRRPWRATSVQRRPRRRVRLQAGFSQPRRVAVASNKNIENNPMQSKQAVAGKDALGQYLTRRANQRHSFIIAQSARRPRASSNNPPNHAARRTSRLRFVRGSHGTTVATIANPQNSRSSRHVTLQRCDLARRQQRERSRSQQLMIAWRQRAGSSAASQGRSRRSRSREARTLTG